MAGYSSTPLARKLGIKEGHTIAAVGAVPPGFRQLVEPLPPGVRWTSRARPPVDVLIAFFTARADVTHTWSRLISAVGAFGTIWVVWPKRSSGVATDLTEDTFREDLLPTGWVDTKVCAVDDTWSGLRFVLRKELRRSYAPGSRPSSGST